MSAFTGAIRGVLDRGDQMYARQTEADRYQKELEKIQRELDLREQAQDNQNTQFYRADDTARYQTDIANDQFGKRLGEDTRQFNEQLDFNQQQLDVERKYKEGMTRYYDYLKQAQEETRKNGRQVDFNALGNLAAIWGSLDPEAQALVKSVMKDGGYNTDFIEHPGFKFVAAQTQNDPEIQQGAAVNAQIDAQQNKGGFWNSVFNWKGYREVGSEAPQGDPTPDGGIFQPGKLGSAIGSAVGNYAKNIDTNVIAPERNDPNFQAGKLGRAIFGGGTGTQGSSPLATGISGMSGKAAPDSTASAPTDTSSAAPADTSKYTQLASAISGMLRNIPGGQDAPQQPTQSPTVNAMMNPVQRAPLVNPTVNAPAAPQQQSYTPAPALPSTYKPPVTQQPTVNAMTGATPQRPGSNSVFGAAYRGVQNANAEFANSQPARTIGPPTVPQSTVRMPNMAARRPQQPSGGIVTAAQPDTTRQQPGGMGSRESLAAAVQKSLYQPKAGQGMFFEGNEYQSFSEQIQKLIEDAKAASPFNMENRNKLSRQVFQQ